MQALPTIENELQVDHRMCEPKLEDRLAMREKPPTSPVMFQRWSRLLFLHWEIPAEMIQARLPDGLHVDQHEGKAYLGIVPFLMEKVRPRFLPCVPWLSNFLELNVRTYVFDDKGRPGVWFFSLDCNQPIAVELARRFFHLPYQHAEMTLEGSEYHCRRKKQNETAVYDFKAEGDLQTAEPGSLEFFLLERYLLFSARPNGDLFTGRVHHAPYTFAPIAEPGHSLFPFHWEGFKIEGPPVSSLVSPGVPVKIHPLQKANRG